MNFKLIINIIQISVAALLILSILMQGHSTGISSVFGGEGGFYRSKRGLEKGLFYFTIALSVLLVFLSFVNVIIRK